MGKVYVGNPFLKPDNKYKKLNRYMAPRAPKQKSLTPHPYKTSSFTTNSCYPNRL